ncbi:MAG: AAA family ATPase [Deltaproteobacteria bacterium]|nr:AAA family ATPase [Deltaproteobacteria bacterium]
MHCPRCQTENPPGAKFCGECGARFEILCAACRTSNPATNNFCHGCGEALAGGTPAEKSPSLQSDMPKHVAEKIFTSEGALEGERKQVTVLFADMKGSMALLADRDPEGARKLLDPLLERMMEAVHRYEGTVNQVMGDGIMALFGAPLAHEDHAVRACYAALRMQESVKRYAEEVQRAEGIPIQIRVGLNSGEVVVRSIGSDLHMDYTAVGQTTHLAARIEQMAMPGSILMTPDTLRLVEGYVRVKPLGLISVKGLTDSIEIYELTGAGAAQTRLQAAAARGFTGFVGREAEMETLHQALVKAYAGHGQIVTLVGEPGIGKSRLVYEFTRSHHAEEWLVLESSLVPYGKATPYLPVIALLKTYFQIEDRDDGRTIREKITGKLLTLDRALQPTLPAFLSLMDVPVEDSRWKALDPPQRRLRTLDAIKRLLLRESQVQPLTLVFEDLHWIDSESQAFLDSLIESLPTARILLLVNYRPEYQHTWTNKTYYTQLYLDPLPPESAEKLLSLLLGNESATKPLKQLLISRTDGNPFFLEESVWTLVETEILAGQRGNYRLARPIESIPVPATVQAVLAARIDRLAPKEKRLLQSAAVIGKSVPFTLQRAIADLPEEELRQGLTNLQSAEFLYETRLFPDLEYTFKHPLTHEVAHGSLLQERRQALHVRLVDAIEKLYPDRLSEHVERLAHHAFEGEAWEKALGYLHQAGKKASAQSANREAVEYFERALEALSHLPATRDALERAVAIRLDLGPALIAIMGYGAPEVEQTYTQARELCRGLGDTPHLFPALWGLCRLHDSRGELQTARELGKQLLALAQRAQDPALLLQAHHTLWATSLMLGEFSTAHEQAERGIALYDPRQPHEHQTFLYGGHDPGVCCRTHAARALWILGYPEKALQRAQDALTLARELSHPFTLAFALFWAAWVHHQRGEGRAAQERAEAGLKLGTEHGFPRWVAAGTILRGWLLVKQGQGEKGVEQIREGLVVQRTTGGVRESTYYHGLLAEACRKAGQIGEGLKAVTEVLARARKTGQRFYEAELHRIKGKLLLGQVVPDGEDAERCFLEAVDGARRQGAKSLELRAAISLSRLWQRQGKRAEARKLLAKIHGWFTEGFDTADLKQAKALLEELT